MEVTYIIERTVSEAVVQNDVDYLRAIVKNLKFLQEYNGSGEVKCDRIFSGDWMVTIDTLNADEGCTLQNRLRKLMLTNPIFEHLCTDYLAGA